MLLKEEERVYCEPEKLPDGFICKRVNTSDWESDPCIGGVFNGSAIWCEAASLVTLADCHE